MTALKPIKVVLLGNASVGKTAIFKRIETQKFNSSTTPTVGSAYVNTQINVDGNEMKLCIWDTAGQDRFRDIVPMYFHDAKVIVLVFSLADRESFSALPQWLELVDERLDKNSNANVIIAANKEDLDVEREVSEDELCSFCAKVGISAYLEISAKTGFRIPELLDQIGRSVPSDKSDEKKNDSRVISSAAEKKESDEKGGCC